MFLFVNISYIKFRYTLFSFYHNDFKKRSFVFITLGFESIYSIFLFVSKRAQKRHNKRLNQRQSHTAIRTGFYYKLCFRAPVEQSGCIWCCRLDFLFIIHHLGTPVRSIERSRPRLYTCGMKSKT